MRSFSGCRRRDINRNLQDLKRILLRPCAYLNPFAYLRVKILQDVSKETLESADEEIRIKRFSMTPRTVFTAPLITICMVILICSPGTAQQISSDSLSQDSILTPFRQGRWLSGLSGTFNSSTLNIESSDNLVSVNSYGLEIFTGTFFKERWFLGANIFVNSTTGDGLIKKEAESLLVGPSVGYYFLKEPYGSLYLSVLPGYFRIRESATVEPEGQFIQELAEGPGFATRMRLGFAYVISDRIVLDVGIGTTLAWVDVNFTSTIAQTSKTESIFANTTFFSFGFNVLLDEFFF